MKVVGIYPFTIDTRESRQHDQVEGEARAARIYDGGTVALWAFWSQFLRPFDIRKNYPHGTIIFRRFRDVNNQGHGAIILGNWRVLQSSGAWLSY